MNIELIDRLERTARFYTNEAAALAETPARRDRRHLGAKEAATIAELLSGAALELRGGT